MFHEASFGLSLTLVAAARSRPALAAAIRRSTRRPENPGWVVEFLRYPRWDRLAEEAKAVPLEEDAVCLNAHAAAFQAAVSGGAHEPEFWERQSSSPPRQTGVVEAAFDDDRPLAELRAWEGPPEPAPLPDHWRLLIEREAMRQTADKRSLQLTLVTTEALDEFLSAAGRLAERDLGAEVAVWLGEQNGRGAGVGPFVAPMECARSHFERNAVPWYFRQSREFELPNSMTAAVFSSVALDGLEEWATTLAKSRGLDLLRPLVVEHLAVEAEVDARYWSAVAEFGAGAGHTINNPLGAIAGLAERLLDGEAEPERRASLHKIRTQVDRIHRMIRDLHFLGKPTKFSAAVTSLADGVRQGVAKALARVGDKPTARCTIHDVPPDLLVPLAPTDLARLVEELVVNGLDAASRQGFVELRCLNRERNIEIQVVDSGPGFSPAELANAFSPFFAGRTAGRGLGMGLPVSRRIAERIGGRIIVPRNRPTTVVASLPIADADCLRQAA